MRQIITLLTVFILTISQKTFACDCNTAGEFLKVAPTSDLVSLIKVTKYLTFKDIEGTKTPMSMEVEIIDIYKGKETKKTIVVWGDNGMECRPYLSEFKIGKYYVIAFFKEEVDYYISICGDYWLQADIEKKIAKGSVTEKQNHIKFTDLKAKLETK